MGVEIEEVATADAYADPPPPSSPAEDTAVDAGAGAHAATPAEPANSSLAENEEVDAYVDPPSPSSFMPPDNEGAQSPMRLAMTRICLPPSLQVQPPGRLSLLLSDPDVLDMCPQVSCKLTGA